MKSISLLISVLVVALLLMFFNFCTGSKSVKGGSQKDKTGNFSIGWSSGNITPDSRVLLHGLFNARISEGVKDPITVTALAIESTKEGTSSAKAILISCDLAVIGDDLRDSVRELLKKSLPELKPEQVIINATHSHSAPEYSAGRELLKEPLPEFSGGSDIKKVYGVELDAMTLSACLKFLSRRVAEVAEQAWKSRKPGGISFGLGHAVVGHNRLVVDLSGKSVLLGKTDAPDFSHLEGYEDHSVNLLYTWDKKSKLTGIVINIACPSQVSVLEYFISADFLE